MHILARTPGIDRLIPIGAFPPGVHFDAYIAMLSVPRILGTTLDNIPAPVPYVFADPALIAHWTRELKPYSSYKIGIAWQGNPKHSGDRHRSLPLAHFAALARLEGVQLFSLQKGPGADQLQQCADRFKVIDLGSKLDETSGAFMDTAAVMKNLDLVITSDTSIAHLAGALGVPVWVALSFVPDWRWLLHGDDSPWYPTMRLFRQSEPGHWAEVFERITAAVQQRLSGATASTPKPLIVEIAVGELIDKITILQIKNERMTDAVKRANVQVELAALEAVRVHSLQASERIETLTGELRAVNERLWDIEDAIRLCERSGDFGARFIELARAVYQHNDRRAAVKRQINELVGSKLIEEKEYSTSQEV